jgi:hypothetical protein
MAFSILTHQPEHDPGLRVSVQVQQPASQLSH